MRIVLMAGGSGTRLWPLSTSNLPKQFISLFDNKKSMLTMTYEKVYELSDNIYVSTQKKYYDIALKQINNSVKIISEPFINDTFAAFLNIAAYLKYDENTNDDEFVAILPTDHDVNAEFYRILFDAQKLLEKSNNSFCLIGVKPRHPSIQYEYILHNNFLVNKFVEKPNELVASELISKGAVWNSGILVFKLGAMLTISKKYLNYNTYQEFINNYAKLPKISFDYEILEKMNNLMVVVSNEEWKDLGTWYTLYNKISSPDSYNTNIINKENKTIVNYGVENALIINTMFGIAMYPKIKYSKVVRNWGYYQILNLYKFENLSIKIKYLKIKPGSNISYQSHKCRNEFWSIIKGTGEVIINGEVKMLKAGDSCFININDKHAIKAMETLEVIEIQQGSKTVEEDIERIEYDWNKISRV